MNSSSPGRVLLVEDDAISRELHNAILLSAGFETEAVQSIAELLQTIKRSRFDIIILDLGLPDGNALDVVPEIRESTSAGIIVATASTDRDDRLAGLEGGADEFLEKPVHPRELLARVRNLAARLQSVRSEEAPGTTHHFEGWQVDLITRKVSFQNGNEVSLTTNEIRLLDTLIRNIGKPVHRDRLISIMSDDEDVTSRAVDKVVYRMRLKLHAFLGRSAPVIETVHSYGYRFIARRL